MKALQSNALRVTPRRVVNKDKEHPEAMRGRDNERPTVDALQNASASGAAVENKTASAVIMLSTNNVLRQACEPECINTQCIDFLLKLPAK